MAITRIDIENFLNIADHTLVVDVRSEGEFAHAHYPGAVSMPLFNNEERKVVGTAYKKESKQQAIKLGLQLFGGKMVPIVETVEELLLSMGTATGKGVVKTVIVYCWRGGMRSGGVGWLLDLYGFKVYTLVGGYKAYRRWSMQQLAKDYCLQVLGGYTGSGKTSVLHEMKKLGKNVIDLEDLAKHKGSAFGNIDMPSQPSQEMFENLLALELKKADSDKMTDDRRENEGTASVSEPTHCIWVEDESQRIGLVNLPTPFFKMLRSKPVWFLAVPFEERLNYLVDEYGKCDKNELVKATARIQKRLGGLEAANATRYLLEDKLKEAFTILLKYYDKQYLKGLHTRTGLQEQLVNIATEEVEAVKNAVLVTNKQTETIHA